MSTSNKNEKHEEELQKHGLRRTQSGYLEWRKDHEEYPRNWSSRRKALDIAIVVFFEFYSTVISTTGPSAATSARKEFGQSRVISLVAFNFMYQFGQAIASLLMPPFSESFGRRRPYLYSSAVYCVGNIVVAVVPAPSSSGVYLGRFISGLASAVPAVVVAGSIEDMFDARKRIWLIWTWELGTVLALAVGPIYGSYITANVGWRWVYWTAAIVSAGIFAALCFIRESRPSKLLTHKIGTLKKNAGSESFAAHDNHDTIKGAGQFLELILFRPTRLLTTEPIIIMVSLLSATACGLIYLFTESFSVVFAEYGWSEEATSLPFIAIILGTPFSVLPRLWDIRVLNRRERLKEDREPEDNLIGFALAAPALAIGLWWFSWSIPPLVHSHWVVCMFGLALIGFAANEIEYTLNGYIAESYTVFASSGIAGLSCARALVSGCLPLFGYQMFSGLGSNVAGSILAAIATVFCITPIIFLKYGRKLRERSKFARYSAEVNEEHGDD